MVAAPLLQIGLLGPPTLVWHHQPPPLLRRQARALLYRLAATPHPISRDLLCLLLWPEDAEAAARRKLTVVLTQLRQALPQPDTLLAVHDALALNPAHVQTDTATMTRLMAQALQHEQTEELATALDLYRGPFLQGFSLPANPEFDLWLAQERQVWERRYLEGLAMLVERHTAHGNYRAAIAATQRLLATDELAEEMHRRLIELHIAVGDRSAALAQFERCVVTLERELGVGPLPQTRAAYEAARASEGISVAVSAQPPPMAAPGPTNPPVPTVPIPPNPLIGRVDELAAITARLQRPEVRILTLCGPGGSGKTRLALEVVQLLHPHFADGVVFVALAPLRDPNQLLEGITQACGLRLADNVPTRVQLLEHLRNKQLLLVLDNLEHLLTSVPLVATLLAGAQNLTLLVTSRIALNTQGEHTFPVPPLPLPDLARLPPLKELALQPAVALLLARTSAHSPTFQLTATNAQALASICCRLDGLPLAIELAAARLYILSPQTLLNRLEQRLALLDHGPIDLPDRQRTLRATMAWSYRLLDRAAQRLFAQLAVFTGGWTLAAAEAICHIDGGAATVLDTMQMLVDANLIVVEGASDLEPRFRMLETIRDYALEQLRTGGGEEIVRRRHAAFYCVCLEQHVPTLSNPEALTALVAIDHDYHNIRLALQWSLEAGEATLAARTFTALLIYWSVRGMIREGTFWATQVVPLADSLPQPLRTRVPASAGMLAYRRGEPQLMAELGASALATAETLEEITYALNVVGLAALELGDTSMAQQRLTRMLALAQAHGLLEYVSNAQANLGVVALTQGRLAEAEEWFQQNYLSCVQLKFDPWIGFALIPLGFTVLLQGDLRRASRQLYQAVQKLRLAPENLWLLSGLLACCGVAQAQQQPLLAATLYGAVARQAEHAGVRVGGAYWRLLAQPLTAVRAALGPEAFEQAFQEGRAHTIEEAIALALALLEPIIA